MQSRAWSQPLADAANSSEYETALRVPVRRPPSTVHRPGRRFHPTDLLPMEPLRADRRHVHSAPLAPAPAPAPPRVDSTPHPRPPSSRRPCNACMHACIRPRVRSRPAGRACLRRQSLAHF
ncbi:hypothetical protein DAEQUDRAFT_730159 [Daedalea quercina L-15889]|uniref:Uncharacterized protein n=1 Tax=Daedalea quercina L-15889 TaxID=1314783 RepID=A0A165N3J2_9APHY|nr:hypothetical protein DAEQUDRAFT_730159 [Daedalea quercina L-15889]